MRLLLGEEVRRPGHDRELRGGQRLVPLDGMGQSHQVIIGQHHERSLDHPGEVGRLQVGLDGGAIFSPARNRCNNRRSHRHFAPGSAQSAAPALARSTLGVRTVVRTESW